MKTIVYSFEPHTGIYQGEAEADESPLEPGVFLLPAHTTRIEPPAEIAAGCAAFWRGPGFGWLIEELPEMVDENHDGLPDAPKGFEEEPDSPGLFRRVINFFKG